MSKTNNFLELIEENNKPDSVWDKYVPIVSNEDGSEYSVYLTNSIDTPSEYNELVYILNNANKATKIDIHINNGGGYIDSAILIMDAMKKSNAKITAKLAGTVASAATMIALAADEIECSPFLSWMIHNYSAGLQGKGSELKRQQQFNDKELERLFKIVYGGFLTDEEIDLVIEDRDMWMNEEEVMERWTKAKEIRG